jgi:NAD(P)-dependent dehydrogenase (short-subunit alcohol dehydrogenase family)
MNDRPVAIVTAASRGMGAACARVLAQRGYNLALLARSDDVNTLAQELNALAVVGNVTEEADLSRLVETTLQRYGRIDAVVNNTGHAPKGELLQLKDEEWQAGFELLFLNAVRLSRIVTPALLQRGSGSIVNISSFGAVEPSLKFPISSALRASLGAFAKLYSERYAREGLRMNNVLPGYISTYPADEATLAKIPVGRAGTAEEVGQVVAFLVSEESRYVTGQNLLVDGGLVRGL